MSTRNDRAVTEEVTLQSCVNELPGWNLKTCHPEDLHGVPKSHGAQLMAQP